MNVRILDIEKEYTAFAPWWGKRGLVPPSMVILQGAHGVAVSGGSLDIAAGFLYVCNKGVIAIVEWAVTNPAVVDNLAKKKALDMLYDFMEKLAKDSGCCVLFTSTQAAGSLVGLLNHRGWKDCPGEPHIHLLKEI